MVYSSNDFESLWFLYRKKHKKVYPITITGRPEEDEAIQTEAEKVSEESQVHNPVKHSTDQVTKLPKMVAFIPGRQN